MAITVKRAEGTVKFCTDLAVRAQWDAATATLEEIRKRPSERMVDVELLAAAETVQDLEAEMSASTLVFHLRALGHKKWQETAGVHPARPDNAEDKRLGVNSATFFDAVATLSIMRVTDAAGELVEFDPEAEWQALADEMTDGQYGDFVGKFLELNRGVTGAPFSRVASLVTRKSDETSNSPNDSA